MKAWAPGSPWNSLIRSGGQQDHGLFLNRWSDFPRMFCFGGRFGRETDEGV